MASGQDVKAVWLNTKAKDSVFATGTEDGAPLVILSPQSDDNDMTQIAFPSMKGWELWATEASRYTVCLCFVRMEKPVETL